MIRKRFVTLFALGWFLCVAPCLNAHDYKMSLIVDTDMALDDVRTLAMLLNSDMAGIRLIVSSDGASSPQAGTDNIRGLLTYFDKKDIAVGIGSVSEKPTPRWRSWSENLNWPESQQFSDSVNVAAAQAILKTLHTAGEDVIYLCLGPLTNLADALRSDPGIKEKISRVIFFGGLPDDANPGWNHARDAEAAEFVFKSGLSIYSLHIPDEKWLRYDQKLHGQIKAIDTPAARLITALHTTPTVTKLLSDGHFRVWDEMTAMFLNSPSLFKFVPAEISGVMQLEDFQRDKLGELYLKLLSHHADSHLDTRKAVVLNDFPHDPSLFREDLSPHIGKIIQKYGFEEWKACLLTNEFHRHLGIYSLVGAKMGIRAREILEAPFDTLQVISLAGNKPPLSCMNDGLQVSTGASLGRGAIRISEKENQPAATFEYKDQHLTLKIKQEIVAKIRSDIQFALKKYGGLNSEYFAHIRKLSIRYWHDFDRKRIFDEK